MVREKLIQLCSRAETVTNAPVPLTISYSFAPEVYPRSVARYGSCLFFLARTGVEKHLWILSERPDDPVVGRFNTTDTPPVRIDSGEYLVQCPQSHENACVLRELFDFLRPVLLGTDNSFGLGDRLGLAGPGHLRAIEKTTLKPVLAQQSIRELERTGRTPDEVMDAAVWAAFQEGYRNGFGGDADHLKTPDDIDLMARAGFTMFTFDPGAYVTSEADSLAPEELSGWLGLIDWDALEDTVESRLKRYSSIYVSLPGGFSLEPDRLEVTRGLVKYGNVIAHAARLYRHLADRCSGRLYEVELSVDETETPTTPFEHFLIVSELKRLRVGIVSLAPRFVGDFEKGIDYKGDLARFEREYSKHLAIAERLGHYKISLHSGSDKFSVYDIIGRFGTGRFHIKTAGTSYLVALETVAYKDAALFREILDFARAHYETEKKSYHVSADLSRVPRADSLSDEELAGLFYNSDTRQVLHVTFGRVLTARSESGGTLFKDRLMECLRKNEADHYAFLERHIRRHLKTFMK